jgi:ribosome-interacting GTPase 1
LAGDYLTLSAETGKGIVEFQNKVWEKLGFVRVFLVRPNQEPDNSNPIIMKKGQTLRDVANELGTSFSENVSKAKIWETGAKFPGQEVSFETKVAEGMQVRFL